MRTKLGSAAASVETMRVNLSLVVEMQRKLIFRYLWIGNDHLPLPACTNPSLWSQTNDKKIWKNEFVFSLTKNQIKWDICRGRTYVAENDSSPFRVQTGWTTHWTHSPIKYANTIKMLVPISNFNVRKFYAFFRCAICVEAANEQPFRLIFQKNSW